MKFTYSMKENKKFKYVLNKGFYSSKKYITVHAIKINRNSNFKKINYLGICVSKKNGISVHRNKMKRWAREAYKQEEINLKKGYNIIILYKKYVKLDMIDFNIIYKQLKECFGELDLYEKS